MHKFVLGCFNMIKNIWYFLKIVCLFVIILLLLFWVQDLTQANWGWLGFITPFFKSLLDISNNICSLSCNVFGAVFEMKYMIAVIILTAMYSLANFLMILTNFAAETYKNTRSMCKKAEEKIMNDKLQQDVTREQLQIHKYSIAVCTAIKPKFSHKELNVDINEQNRLMNEFIFNKLGIKPQEFEGGFIYHFNDFNRIDGVLDVLFKVLHSSAPLDYAICVQAGYNIEQLTKLAALKQYQKIIMAADTSYRYKFNGSHGYQTSQVGLFQFGNKAVEVHEFKELL